MWINSLWYSSLVCSLIAASLGLLVKQWLRSYATEDLYSPRERVRVRQRRFTNMHRWWVPGIVVLLPLLLRISLTLFLIGLAIFLWIPHPVLTSIVGTLIIIWLVCYILTSILPAFVIGCPYKSGEAYVVYYCVQLWKSGFREWGLIPWERRDSSCQEDEELEIIALVTASRLLTYSDSSTILRNCANDLEGVALMNFIDRAFCQRFHLSFHGPIRWTHVKDLPVRLPATTQIDVEILLQPAIDCLTRIIALHVATGGTTAGMLQEELTKQIFSFIVYVMRSVDSVDSEVAKTSMPRLLERLLKSPTDESVNRMVFTFLSIWPSSYSGSLRFGKSIHHSNGLV